MAHAIEVREVSKSYGGKLVIDKLSFVVESGTVTGFLGPNGSGKSTTMRLIVGLDHPSHGSAYLNGVEYDAIDFDNSRKRGTRYRGPARLGIATALLGDPSILILDEPVNGLDPDGTRWSAN